MEVRTTTPRFTIARGPNGRNAPNLARPALNVVRTFQHFHTYLSIPLWRLYLVQEIPPILQDVTDPGTIYSHCRDLAALAPFLI